MTRSPRNLLWMTLAVVLAVSVVGAALLQRPQDGPELTPPQAQAGPATTTLETETLQIGASRAQTRTARVGVPLRLTIEGAGAPDVVEIVGLDQQAQISPQLDAVFDLLPDRAGTYQIVLRETDERIGALRVESD